MTSSKSIIQLVVVLALTYTVIGGSVFLSQQKQAVELAANSRLPVVYHQREYVDVGGSISYGVSVADFGRRAATYVDELLKGTKPADLSVEQPRKFEFLVNLKAPSRSASTFRPTCWRKQIG